jgi:hypothetical protein
VASTYEPIASTTLGSNSNSISFSSIPGTYTDLRMVASLTLGANDALYITINGAGSGYSQTKLYGTGSSASSWRGTSRSRINFGDVFAAVASGQQMFVADFFSYANTNVYKTLLCAYAHASSHVVRDVGLYGSTSAITSITLVGALQTGTTVSLYGIKAA